MSKKSRKRNKKILGALAAGLGAMALMKRKKAALSASVADQDNAGLGVTHSALQGPFITKKADTAVVPDGGTFAGGIHQDKTPKGEILKQRRLRAMNKVPPSMRGGAAHAEGYTPRIWTGDQSMTKNNPWRYKGGGIAKRGKGVALKSGGSVTGIAKRGFGRALMKGKK